MAVTGLRPRSQPQTSGNGLSGRQPVNHVSTSHGRHDSRGTAMPRAASTPNMYQLAELPFTDEDPELVWREVAREQIDAETLRALAQFFRTTAPPIARAPSMDVEPDCLRVPGDRKRWSIQSLKKGRRSRRPLSLQFPLPENAVRSTTAAGHRYIAISLPPVEKRNGIKRNSLQRTRSSAHNSVSNTYTKTIEPHWPPRTSSKQALSPVRNNHRLNVKEEEGRAEQGLQASGDTDDFSARASTLQLYGNVLRFLNSSPIDDDNTRTTVGEKKPQGTDAGPTNSPVVVISPEPSHTVDDTRPTLTFPTITIKRSASPSQSSPRLSLSPTTRARATQSPKRRSRRASSKSPKRRASPSPSVATTRSQTRPSSVKSNKSMPTIETSRSSKHQRRPTNPLAIKSSLAVPKTSTVPESPGFPALLANLSFPSPPDSSPAHSPKNSISSTGPLSTPGTPPSTARSLPFRTGPHASLDGRIVESRRPNLRTYKSDGGLQNMHTPEESFPLNDNEADHGITSTPTARTSRPDDDDARDETTDFGSKHEPILADTIAGSENGDKNDTVVEEGTENLHEPAVEDAEVHQHVQEECSAPQSVDGDSMTASLAQPTVSRRESYSSMTILDRKRSRWSLAGEPGTMSRVQPSEEGIQDPDHTRSESPFNGTNEATRTLAERRKARREKVKEKFHKDMDASMSNSSTLKVPAPSGLADAVDSPILGWFNQDAAPGDINKRKASLHGPSPLTRMSASEASEADASKSTSDVSTRTSSVYEEAVQSSSDVPTGESVADTAERTDKTFSIATSVDDEFTSSTRPVSEMKLTPTRLSLSAVMVVAAFEGNQQSPPSRPRSLLNPGTPPSRVVSGTLIRTESKRPRPVPIKVAPTPARKARQSSRLSQGVPSIPTPPMSPKSTSSTSRRMSLPLQGSHLQPATSDPSTHSSLDASVAPQLSKERETQWLQAHQRETAHEWRLAALKERMRIQRLALEKDLQDDPEYKGMSLLNHEETEEEYDEEPRNNYRETLSISSLASLANTTKTNRLDALRQLNANTPTTTTTRPSRESTPTADHRRASYESDVFYDAEGGGVEKRLDRLEQNCDAWMVAIKSNLENMNRMLGEMQRQSVGRELTMKLMDSALAAADASARSSAKRQATIASLYSEVGRSSEGA